MQEAITSIALGLLATTSPCVFPLYPGFLAYLSGSQENIKTPLARYFLGFFVLAGLLTMMLILGAIIAALAVSVGSALRVVIPIADMVIFALGVLLILNINPFKALPQIKVPALSHPFANSYIYGLLYGPITLPCSGPLVVSIFALSITAADFLGKLSVFLWFGLGFGIPLLVLSFLAGGLQRQVTRLFARHSRAVNLVGGLLLVGVAIFDLIANWQLIFG